MRALAAALAALALAGCRPDPSTFVPIEDGDAGTDADVPSGIHVQVTPAMTTVSEGGQTTVQVRLSEAPPDERTVDIVGGTLLTPTPASLTFTPETWAVNRTVILAAAQDDDADDSPLTVLFSGRGEVADGAATVMVTDDDELALAVTPPISVGITEGATAEVQVFLSARPSNQLIVAVMSADGTRASVAPGSLVFTPDAWSMPQTVIVTAAQDSDTANATTALVLDPERDGLATRTIGVDVTDDDILAIDVTPTNLGTLTEAAGVAHAATLGVRLTQQPPGNVVVDLSAAPARVALSPSRIVFTPADYATVRDVTVTALDDDDDVDEQVAVRLAAAGLSDRFVHAAIDDDDTQVLLVTPLVVPPLAEGATAGLGVRLAHRPGDTVLVTVASTAPDVVAIDTAQLTFTPANFGVVQTVHVTAVEDANLLDGSATITFNAAAAGLTASRAVEVDDQDAQSLVVSSASLAVGEGDQASFTVRLLHEPAGPVAVSVATAAAELGIAPATLTFTPIDYAMPQAVVVTGQQDPDTADEHVVVTVGAPSIDSQTLEVTILDDDAVDITVAPAALMIGEGASQQLMVSLAAQPSADLTVTLSAQPAGVVTLGATSLTFTPSDYATPRAVMVGGADDADTIDETATIRLAAPGLTDKAVPVDVVDDDTAAPIVTPTPVTVAEGVPDSTVRLRLAADPGGAVTVAVSSSPGVAVAPSSFTFDSSDWSSGQAVTLTTYADDTADDEVETVTFSIAGQGQTALTVNVDDPTVLVGFPAPHGGTPTTPDQLVAFQASAMPSCWVIDKVAIAVATAGNNGIVKVGLYDQAANQPARRVWQSASFSVGSGAGVRILDIGDVQVAPLNAGAAWIAVETSNNVSLEARTGTVAACARDHAFANDLPDPFDASSGSPPSCGARPALGVWLIGRTNPGCP